MVAQRWNALVIPCPTEAFKLQSAHVGETCSALHHIIGTPVQSAVFVVKPVLICPFIAQSIEFRRLFALEEPEIYCPALK